MATKKKEQQDTLSTHNLYQTTVSGYQAVVERMISNLPPAKCPAMIAIGAVGIGKTESVYALFNNLREKGVVKSLNVRHLSQVHPLDTGGVGIDPATRTMYFAKPPLVDDVMGSKERPNPGPRILFLDEIDRIQPIAQSGMLQVLSEKKLNGFDLEDTYVIGAGNAWHAQYTFEMDKAFASRPIIMHIETSISSWLHWALDHGVHESVITAIQLAPDILNQHDDFKDTDLLKVADPRAWTNFSHALNHNAAGPTDAAMFVGENAGRKYQRYYQFRNDYSELIEQLLNGKSVETEDANLLLAVYLTAAGQVTKIPQAYKFLTLAKKQIGDEKSYIVGRLLTYRIPTTELLKDEKIKKLHHLFLEKYKGE
jgi:hypothetical protein